MKRILAFLMTFALLLGATSCTSCNKEVKQMETVVEQVVQSDRQWMCDQFGNDYIYYETQIVLKEWLDDENCTGTVASILNVFQIVKGGDTAFSPHVYLFKHTDSTFKVKVVDDAWMEDQDMAKDAITITYRQAYKKLMKANCIKPHTKNCVLRKMVGPYECNPQYIFGDAFDECVFVDAFTGEVSLDNPAFAPPQRE
ncbi:MAG: hypothetical protein SPJ13_01510 [Bacteroidales bacterium]|nr:hypothetical protein [Bacteroidales bacterium]